jgi:hypothetical protein
MSTGDVPGSNPANGDNLHVGCWSEHADGSLIFVAGAERGLITYSIFDPNAAGGMLEYRTRMAEKAFRDMFVSKAPGTTGWTWHDKKPFDWDRVIKAGATEGARYASAADQLSAAAQIAADLNLRARELSRQDVQDTAERHGWQKPLEETLRGMADLVGVLRGMRR